MVSASVTAIGEKRPGFGSGGTEENNDVNVEQGACRETRDVRRRRDEGDAGTREREHAGEG